MQPQKKSVDATQVLNKAILNAALYLKLPQNELSKITGISPSQISRLFNQGTPCITQNTKEWECALLFLRALRSLESMVGEDQYQVQQWLQSYNHHLRGIPLEKMKTISGLNEVTLYLDAMRG